MSNEAIMAKIKEKLALASSLDAKVKFDFGDEGVVMIDATQNPPLLSDDDDDADTTFVTSIDTFKGILEGTQDPNIAFMMGKLKVQGSMGIAMKLNAILED
ncbi:MAG: SCP2 sterol-binding domain-containing protein [Bdellovibrionales bacterium]